MTTHQPLVLVVDDDTSLCALVRRWLESSSYKVEVFHDGESCLAGLARALPHVICLDLSMPGLSGLETLERIRGNHPFLPVVILTADTSVDAAVGAMQRGAYDYLTKPIDRTKLLTTIKNAVDRYRISMRLTQLEREVEGRRWPGIVGNSFRMKELYRQMVQVTANDITVLIHGESGTGKELVARAIHDSSGRRNGPFVAVNCAAIPESLQESELFGHERGAFTGATNRRTGKFEQANGGTLLLDEVAELSLPLQAKLLRVLQDRAFHRLGGSNEIRSDFRLIAATHRDLPARVRANEFRDDLYFRIAVFEVEVPTLRDRPDDIPILAQKFLVDFARKEGREVAELSPETLQLLRAYHWPGNVRELQNAIQRAFVVSNGQKIVPSNLPTRVLEGVVGGGRIGVPTEGTEAAGEVPGAVPTPAPLGEVDHPPPRAPSQPAIGEALGTLNLEDMERRAIEEALKRWGGNLSQACRQLGIGRTTLYRKLKKYNLR